MQETVISGVILKDIFEPIKKLAKSVEAKPAAPLSHRTALIGAEFMSPSNPGPFV